MKNKSNTGRSNQSFEDSLLCGKLLTIIESISDGVFTVDLDYKITFLNQAAERITGYSKDEALGKSCADILKTNICDEGCALRQTIASRQPIVNKLVCLTNKKGQRTPISISTALLKDNRGRIIGGVESFRDLNMVERLRQEFETTVSFENILSRDHKML